MSRRSEQAASPVSRGSVVEFERVNLVKVFSVTKAGDRAELGDRVTSWLNDHPGVEVLDAVVQLTSDSSFHCMSIVLFAAA
jgi:hypothetical protein